MEELRECFQPEEAWPGEQSWLFRELVMSKPTVYIS